METCPSFVTGGCGFVGRHLVNKLLENGQSVWILDNLFTGQHPDKWLKGFTKISNNGKLVYQKTGQEVVFIERDALDFFLDQIKNRSKESLPNFSDVFHLASVVGGRAIIEGDPMLVASDLAIDSLFFLWASKNKNRLARILYASSSAVYPVHLQTRYTKEALSENHVNFEKEIGVPDMTYGWSKLSGEYLSRFASKYYGLHVACVRPFSGYGEDQDLAYPVPALATRIGRRENPVEVWGTGEQGRDFVNIDDCINAFFVVLDKVSDGSGVNIGTGKLTSFNQVLSILAKLEGYSPSIKPLINKPVGVHARYTDITKIQSLGWRPKISLEEGLGRVLHSVKNNL